MSNAVTNTPRQVAPNPRSLSAQLHLASAQECLRRVKAHDRLPALMAQKAFKDATRILLESRYESRSQERAR